MSLYAAFLLPLSLDTPIGCCYLAAHAYGFHYYRQKGMGQGKKKNIEMNGQVIIIKNLFLPMTRRKKRVLNLWAVMTEGAGRLPLPEEFQAQLQQAGF
ncbi:MAG: hypothetical protein AB1585_00395 [Thermodesulfobacteriota bacterium]